MKTFICDQENIRLDRYLRRHVGDIPQSVIQKKLRLGRIKINGKKVEANHRLSLNDEVVLFEDLSTYINTDDKQSYVLSKEEQKQIDQMIIFEDDDLCIINKPSGLAVQGGTGTKKHLDGMLQHYRKNTKFFLVHRLDKDTSGLLILGKSAKVAHELTELFKNKDIKKTYLAVVHQKPSPRSGRIDAPLLKDMSGKKEIMMVSPSGKKAITDYEVITSFNHYTLIQLNPITGRTHQLRVHMSHIGHPIVGDYKYGSTAASDTRLHLHAYSIYFPYGKKKIEVTFKAPVPDDGFFKKFQGDVS